MGLWETMRNPAFRMGLHRATQIWRHCTPPYPTLPPLDMSKILLPLPYQPSPFDGKGDWLSQGEFDEKVQAWSRGVDKVNKENDLRMSAWEWGMRVGLALMLMFYLLLIVLVGFLVFCVVG